MSTAAPAPRRRAILARSSQASLITLAAAAAMGAFYLLPKGTGLTPIDFLGDEHSVLQFCDPVNPRPLPVLAGSAPASVELISLQAADAGHSRRAILRLATIGGKPIGPEDVLPEGHPSIRIQIADSAGRTYSGEALNAASKPGEWAVEFGKVPPGSYKATADFTPVATGKEIEAKGSIVL